MFFYQPAFEREGGRRWSTLGWTIVSGLPEKMAPPSSVIPNINSGSLRLYKRLIFFLSALPNNPPTMPFCTELFNFLLISHPVSKSRAISHRLQASCPARDASPAGFDIFMAGCLIYPIKRKEKKKSWKCILYAQTKSGPSCSLATQISCLYPLSKLCDFFFFFIALWGYCIFSIV